MGPPSAGGIAVAQTLGMLAAFDLGALPPEGLDGDGGRPDMRAVHLITEAQRLAFADRNRYVADTDFVPLPGAGVASLLAPAYLQQRARLIRSDASLGVAPAGEFLGATAMGASAHEGSGTSHVAIVDAAGNAVSMTTTIESSLGAYRLVRGFLLNNELTDFSPLPANADGPIANRLAPLKRPRSSMAPTLVFRRAPDGSTGELLMVTGSPGGAAIIPYVIKTLVAVLDWGLDAQQSAALANFGAFNTATTVLGGEHPRLDTRDGGALDPLVTGLQARGHRVVVNAQPSGVATILRVRADGGVRWQAGVDPRREGLALGD
jgi:gamma-glutamyltranspeptidase/glutathione hydrolase